jgi:hypothetical protein
MKNKIQMKHIKLFEDIYSTLPSVPTETIKGMSEDEFITYIQKLIQKEEYGEIDAAANIYLTPGRTNSDEFLLKLKKALPAGFKLNDLDVTGKGTEDEWATMRDESEMSKSRLKFRSDFMAQSEDEFLEHIRLYPVSPDSLVFGFTKSYLKENPNMKKLFSMISDLVKDGILQD